MIIVVGIFAVKLVSKSSTPLPPKIVMNVDSLRGAVLFRRDCNKCHAGKGQLHNFIIGVTERRSKDYLIAFISNEDSLLKMKDPYVTRLVEVYKVWGNHQYKYTEEEFHNLFEYLKN